MLKIAFLLIVLAGVKDRESLRFLHCTEQGFDNSCGLSVLACLMDKYWNFPSDELALAVDYLSNSFETKEFQISFAVMAEILEKKGFLQKAYKMDYEQLCQATERFAPVIVHFSKPKGHFALVLAVNDHWILVADPAEGCIFIEQSCFQERWSGALLAAIGTKTAKNSALLAEAIDSAESRLTLLQKASSAIIGNARW
ncbi:MAG: cysteine peptidase family C39 domain-containing protein [Spirochaetia bacterium]|jgi:hypothetical protein|nr:cysteine peptidase family C39 domain-containing protein [Spirochaetia bacterium]